METFTLDTSGEVYVQRATSGGPFTYVWSDLDPFTQGYIEALFAGGVACEWCAGRREVGGWVGQTAESHYYETAPCECVRLGFSDLAPETLAAILKDCEVIQPTFAHLPDLRQIEGGRDFLANRQNGHLRRYHLRPFPPLTPYLGDDGLVRFREVSDARS